jgi:hypothetical protein
MGRAARDAADPEGAVRIYVASSWRNAYQPPVVVALRAAGHDVYDFRNPRPGDEGFHWTAIEPAPKPWSGETLRAALRHPVAVAGFASDMDALRACDVCVLVLPCGRSAHLELGWAVAAGKITSVLMVGPDEPELMYAMVDDISTSTYELIAFLQFVGGRPAGGRLR